MNLKIRGKEFLNKKGGTVLLIIVLLMIASSAVLILGKRSKGHFLAADDILVLAYTDFTNSISATGTVESASSTFVYSSLPNQVEQVLVEVGDQVEEGELLAKLDDQNIQEQIESQETNMRTASAGNAQAIKAAQDNYDQFKSALDKGLNAGINSAKSQVEAADENYNRARKVYERYRDSLDAGENAALLNQESALAGYRLAREKARGAFDEAKAAEDDAYERWKEAEERLGGLSAEDGGYDEALGAVAATKKAWVTASDLVEKLEREVRHAQENYDLAWAQYRAALTGADQTLADYAEAVDSAERAYEDALTNLQGARLTAENQLRAYADALESAKIGADDSGLQLALRQLRVTLDSTRITAPVSGTVTAVYATTGMAGSGLLFVIEDIGELIVETSVKEYDIGAVREGLPVTIKSNATGNDVYEGEIVSIAPTANKTALGKTDTSGEVEFATRVRVTTAETRLRVGMNVRLSYIIEEQSGVLSVPYDTLYANQEGEECILILEEQPEGAYLFKELPVTRELENDLGTTISGRGVSAGLRIIGEPEKYRSQIGQEVKLME